MTELTATLIDDLAAKREGPVALCMKQRLLPVEGEGGVIFPPTYADIGYNLDTLSDGTRVVTMDSVGSQANRMEPIFKVHPYSDLVPQIEIEFQAKNREKGSQAAQSDGETRSLLDLAHRGADAVVSATPELNQLLASAFRALHHGNAKPLACIAPTSLVFGVWDSRGGSGEKRPRLVRSIIRAWDVDPLFAAAQFNSAWKQLDEEDQRELEKEAKSKKVKLSAKGFADAPATFRKVSTSGAKHMPEYRDGSPNPERRVLGGVRVNGRIERDVTINLVALRSILGGNDEETMQLRRYLLSLALLAATHDFEHWLREGCSLHNPDLNDQWQLIPRRGDPTQLHITRSEEIDSVFEYAKAAAVPFKSQWPARLKYRFDVKEAKKLLAKKDEDDATQKEGE